MNRFRPLHDRVLVLPDAAPVKLGGLAQPKSQEAEPTQGTVVECGPKARPNRHVAYEEYTDSAGNRCLVVGDWLRCGDVVQWSKYAGRELEINGVKHRLLRLEEIDGIIEDVKEGTE